MTAEESAKKQLEENMMKQLTATINRKQFEHGWYFCLATPKLYRFLAQLFPWTKTVVTPCVLMFYSHSMEVYESVILAAE